MDLPRMLVTRTPLQHWMRARNRTYGRILMYHRVVNDRVSPSLRVLLSGAITCTAFRRQLDYLDRYYRIVDLEELLTRRDDLSNKVAITFDDGYADNFLNAMPLLSAKGIPATIFMTAGFMQSGQTAWRDRLARKIIKKGPVAMGFETGNELKSFPFEGDYRRQMYAAEKWLITLDEDARQAQLADQPAEDEDRFLDVHEMKQLEQNQIKMQSHTVNHPRLSKLDEDATRWELSQSKALLEGALDSPIDLLAYPYGDFDAVTQALAREAGYRAAVTAERGYFRPDTHLFSIPRIGTREGFDRFKHRIMQNYQAA